MKGKQARDELDDASGWQQKEKARVKKMEQENSKSLVQQSQQRLIQQDFSEMSTNYAQL